MKPCMTSVNAVLVYAEAGSRQKCLWSLNQTFALWSSTTTLMQQMLVEKGLMVGVLLELQAFSNCPTTEVIPFGGFCMCLLL